MKRIVIRSLLLLLSLASFAAVANSADFPWIPDFNRRAAADLVEFRANLSARFNVGPAQIDAIIGRVPTPADVYLIFRFGEMSGKSPEYVLTKYKAGKRGWGALAQSLGIKPGSREFHALKQGHDLHAFGSSKIQSGPSKGKNSIRPEENHGNGKGKGGKFK